MAGYHKKRRRPGPSKNEEKVSRSKDEERRSHPSNWLGNRYESVEKLSLEMELIGTHGELLGQESRRFGREDACGFAIPCPGLCGGGSFELGAKINDIVASREPHTEASVVCPNKTNGLATVCGVTLKFKLDAVYRAAPAPAPAPEPSSSTPTA
jgi:hypothetical protein